MAKENLREDFFNKQKEDEMKELLQDIKNDTRILTEQIEELLSFLKDILGG